jgi:hypothetical protein
MAKIYNAKMNMAMSLEQRLPKVCLTPHRLVDRNIYNPAKIRKILESHNVVGVKQVYIPQKQQAAHASIIFRTADDRDNFMKRFSEGFALTSIETDKLTVDPWYSADEREHHRVRQNLAKSRGFFCRDVPKDLTREQLLEQLPNAEAITFAKTMFNEKNTNLMASFCYKTVEDAADFVTLSSTGVLRLTVSGQIHDVHVEPFRNMQKGRSFVQELVHDDAIVTASAE